MCERSFADFASPTLKLFALIASDATTIVVDRSLDLRCFVGPTRFVLSLRFRDVGSHLHGSAEFHGAGPVVAFIGSYFLNLLCAARFLQIQLGLQHTIGHGLGVTL